MKIDLGPPEQSPGFLKKKIALKLVWLNLTVNRRPHSSRPEPGSHGRLMGSTLAPHGHPWLPKMVFCVNLNRNLTGQLGTYCKLTEPIWPEWVPSGR